MAKSAESDLEFFNSLSGELEIELSIPATPIGNLLNVEASPDARIVSVRLRAEVFQPDQQSFRELTAEELDSVAYREASISLRGESETVVFHTAPNGEFFTVRELLAAVEATERQTRDESEWREGVDVQHVFFEGIAQEDDEVWQICWGS